MKLYVARHGQTAWNQRDVVCGRTDLPLTQQGLQQARQLAQQVEGTGIDMIWSSPLRRARQTAQAVADQLGLTVQVENRLIEQHFGSYEGVSRLDPDYMAYRRNLLLRFPGGGESIAMVMARAYGVVEDIRSHYPDHTLLLVSHGAFLRSLNTYFVPTKNEDFFHFRLENCQLQAYDLPAVSPSAPCADLRSAAR